MNATQDDKPSRYSWYVVIVLLGVYMVHHLDRMVVTLLLEPIGRDFKLSDSQLGLLAGMAYAIPFAIAGLPLGMLVDRVNRVRLLTVLLTIWSGLTALAAFATGFWTLLLARVGVAAAESGATPTNVSIIADQMPASKRGTAFGVYYMAPSLGTIIGFSAAGAVASAYGWRAGFLVAGLPGLLLALVLWRTVREPARMSNLQQQGTTAPPLREALREIGASKPALHLIIGSTIMGMFGIGLSTWLPALMIRIHGADVATVGAALAFAISPFGALAALLGGRMSDVLHARGPTGVPRFLAALSFLILPAAAAAILSPSFTLLVVASAVQVFLQSQISAPSYSTVMHHLRPEIRGVAASVMQVSSNVLGFGVGAQVIGLTSDALHTWSPDQSLRYAMLGYSTITLWAFVHFLLAARAMRTQAAGTSH